MVVTISSQEEKLQRVEKKLIFYLRKETARDWRFVLEALSENGHEGCLPFVSAETLHAKNPVQNMQTLSTYLGRLCFGAAGLGICDSGYMIDGVFETTKKSSKGKVYRLKEEFYPVVRRILKST